MLIFQSKKPDAGKAAGHSLLLHHLIRLSGSILCRVRIKAMKCASPVALCPNRSSSRQSTSPPNPWPEEEGDISVRLANYNHAVGATTPIGSYPDGATPEGLYDMAGNVWEWTDSWYDDSRSSRVLRGGSWHFSAERCRSASRTYSIGFRLVFVPQSVGSSFRLCF